jgi:hypothetical protein
VELTVEKEKQNNTKRFDWYAAGIALGVTAPFAIWALLVIAEFLDIASHRAIAIGVSLAFMAFVFWAFGTIKVK